MIPIQSLQDGKYRIESLLGSGGFGNTYLATQTALGRKVAIKEFYMKEYCDREANTSRVIVPTEGSRLIVDKYKNKFLKEAQMISSLENEHIIHIYDIFQENDTVYYVMDYISGGSLKDKIDSAGAMDEQSALKYVLQVAEALAYIHSNNILHLDVKPANILLDGERSILIDFGISKHYDSDGGQTSTTPVGISKGYAPIEQYQQGNISGFTPSTDVYSLGATLFSLLTGETPPEASEVYEEGLPSSIDGFSEPIVTAIKVAMSPKRKDRYQSVQMFADVLSPLIQESETDSLQHTAEKTVLLQQNIAYEADDTPVGKHDENTILVEEETVVVATEKREYVHNIQDAAEEKISGWLAFFLWVGIGLNLVISFIQVLFQADVLIGLLYVTVFAVIGIKTIVAFYKRHENAVPLAITFCLMSAMNAIYTAVAFSILGLGTSTWSLFWGLLWASIWLTYLKASYVVNDMFPVSERRWHKFEKYTLVALATFYLVSILFSLAVGPYDSDAAATSAPQKITSPSVQQRPASVIADSMHVAKPATAPAPAPEPVVDQNAEKLSRALRNEDYSTVQLLADRGYVPAYLPLAKYYLLDPSTHNKADYYANMAKNAGIKKAQAVIDALTDQGFYD